MNLLKPWYKGFFCFSKEQHILIGTIYLNQTHLILRDVDGSEVSLTLEDALQVYNFVKDHLSEIEALRQANWQE
jgi:hypothetical protein